MNQEMQFSDVELEQAMAGIRNEQVDDAVVEAAASRVWAKLAAAREAGFIGNCSEFQVLIPDFKAGRLAESKVLLLRDHLHECVACRRVYEGRSPVAASVAVMPQRAPRTGFRLAVAAAVVASAGATVWLTMDHSGTAGRAIVQAVNGSLFEVTGQGITPLIAGQDLPDGVEIRTAKDSGAVLQLRDGSVVEMRERSGFSTETSASDLIVRLLRGSVIVQAAKRKAGHLYVSTSDCRVAVTGTIFGVSAGSKGSRVSVVQGEVHVEQNNHDNVLHPGGQMVIGSDLDPEPVSEDIAWSRDHARYDSQLKQLADLRDQLRRIALPGLRYSSSLLPRLPALTTIYVSIPNLAAYLGEAENVLDKKLSESPVLQQWWAANGARSGALLEKLRGAGEYLGDEIALVGTKDSPQPVFVAEVKREGFADYVKKNAGKIAIEQRNGLAVLGAPEDVKRVAEGLDDPKSGFQKSVVYAHAMDEFHRGAGFLLVADISQRSIPGGMEGMQYVVAGEKQSGKGLEARLTMGFSGNRTGLAAWLANPGPMGSLDYISHDATVVGSFLVKDASAITDQVGTLIGKSPESLGPARAALAASLGGEFTIALDGPAMPVPAWRLVAEVYNPSAAETAIEQAVQQYNASAAKDGTMPVDVSQEDAGGKTLHRLAVHNSGPLMVFYYTFDNGYLIAGPQRVQVEKALQVKASGNSILRSSSFVAMMPQDHHANFSGLLFQNLGTTLAPLAGLLAGLGSQDRRNPLNQLSNLKPSLIGAYAEPNKLTFATNGDVLGPAVGNLMGGNLHGVAAGALPFLPMLQGQGARRMQEVH